MFQTHQPAIIASLQIRQIPPWSREPRLKGASPSSLAEFFAREAFLLILHLHAVRPTHLAQESVRLYTYNV